MGEKAREIKVSKKGDEESGNGGKRACISLHSATFSIFISYQFFYLLVLLLGLISFFNPVFMGLGEPPKWMVASISATVGFWGGDELKKKCLSMSIPLSALLSAIILHDI